MNSVLLIIILASIPLLAVIIIPVRYELGFAYHNDLKLYAAIRQRAIFCLVIEKKAGKSEFKLRLFNIPCSFPRKNKKLGNNIPESKQGISSIGEVFKIFIHTKTYGPLGKLIIRLFRAIKPQHLHINGQYGFYEPHHTAWVNVLLLLVSNDSFHYKVELEPVWDDEILDVEGCIKGAITLAGTAWHLIRFVLSPSFWKFLLKLLQERKRKKTKTIIAVQP